MLTNFAVAQTRNVSKDQFPDLFVFCHPCQSRRHRYTVQRRMLWKGKSMLSSFYSVLYLETFSLTQLLNTELVVVKFWKLADSG